MSNTAMWMKHEDDISRLKTGITYDTIDGFPIFPYNDVEENVLCTYNSSDGLVYILNAYKNNRNQLITYNPLTYEYNFTNIYMPFEMRSYTKKYYFMRSYKEYIYILNGGTTGDLYRYNTINSELTFVGTFPTDPTESSSYFSDYFINDFILYNENDEDRICILYTYAYHDSSSYRYYISMQGFRMNDFTATGTIYTTYENTDRQGGSLFIINDTKLYMITSVSISGNSKYTYKILLHNTIDRSNTVVYNATGNGNMPTSKSCIYVDDDQSRVYFAGLNSNYGMEPGGNYYNDAVSYYSSSNNTFTVCGNAPQISNMGGCVYKNNGKEYIYHIGCYNYNYKSYYSPYVVSIFDLNNFMPLISNIYSDSTTLFNYNNDLYMLYVPYTNLTTAKPILYKLINNQLIFETSIDLVNVSSNLKSYLYTLKDIYVTNNTIHFIEITDNPVYDANNNKYKHYVFDLDTYECVEAEVLTGSPYMSNIYGILEYNNYILISCRYYLSSSNNRESLLIFNKNTNTYIKNDDDMKLAKFHILNNNLIFVSGEGNVVVVDGNLNKTSKSIISIDSDNLSNNIIDTSNYIFSILYKNTIIVPTQQYVNTGSKYLNIETPWAMIDMDTYLSRYSSINNYISNNQGISSITSVNNDIYVIKYSIKNYDTSYRSGKMLIKISQ